MLEKHPDRDYRFALCAVCFSGSRVVSFGFNKPKTEAAIKSITETVRKMYEQSKSDFVSECRHAEVDALKRAKGNPDTIIVVRKNKMNELACAKPCNICYKFIAQAGIKKIIFSNQAGHFTTEVIQNG